MPREQGESGEFIETVAPEDVLDVFDTVDGPVILSADVADHFDVTRETARRKLQQLYDRGDLDRRKVSRRVIYWRATGGDGFDTEGLQGDPATTLDADTHGAHDAEAADPMDTSREDTNAERERTAPESDPNTTDDLGDRVREYLDANDIPPKTAHGQDAVLDVFHYLREHGSTKTGELQKAIYPDYADEWGSARIMWNAIDRYLDDIPGIEKGGYGEWAYTGDDAVYEGVA